MWVYIDKQGSIKIPAALRKELGLKQGSLLELTVLEGGHLSLVPVEVYPILRLSEHGLGKLREARRSGFQKMPEWLRKEISVATTVSASSTKGSEDIDRAKG